MISAADLITSVGRLTALAASARHTHRSFRSAAPNSAAEDAASDDLPPATAPPTSQFFRPVSNTADSLIGLASPVDIDAKTASLSLASIDLLRVRDVLSPEEARDAAMRQLPVLGRNFARFTQTMLLPQIARQTMLARGRAATSLEAHANAGAATGPNAAAAAAAEAAPNAGSDAGSDAGPPDAELFRLSMQLTEQLQTTPNLLTFAGHVMRADHMEGADVVRAFTMDILNAAMIPGWPVQARHRSAAPVGVKQPAASIDTLTEAHLLEIVAALGGNEALQNHVFSELDDSDGRRKLLRAITILTIIIGAFVTALRAEIEELLTDFEMVAGSEAPVAWAGRIRLRLK